MPDRFRISAHFDLVTEDIDALRPVAAQVLTQMREVQQATGTSLAGDSEQLIDNDIAVASLLALFVLARNDHAIAGLRIMDAHVDATRTAAAPSGEPTDLSTEDLPENGQG